MSVKNIKLTFNAILEMILGFLVGVFMTKRKKLENENKWKEMSNKHFELFLLMNEWVKIKQQGKEIASYLIELNISRIAIYGMSYVGETLLRELENSEIQVIYGIDQKADSLYSDIDMITMEDSFSDVDAVIVTAITYFDEIKEELSKKIECPIISLEDLVYEV